MNRVSPFRKGIVRVTTAPAVSPQPKPPMRRANFLPRPVAPGSGLLLARRHGWNLRSAGAALHPPLGCGSHTWCGVLWGCFWAASRRPWGRFRAASMPRGRGRVPAIRAGRRLVERRAPGEGWGRPGDGSRGASMHNLPTKPLRPDRGVLRMWGMRGVPRSADLRSIGRLCMLCEPPRAGRPAPAPVQVPPLKTRSALDHRGISDHARAARMRGIRLRPARGA